MRSSDIWLGLPYDVFNFSMLGWLMLGCYNSWLLDHEPDCQFVLPGELHLTAVSSHLYDTNLEAARLILNEGCQLGSQLPVPSCYLTEPDELITLLKDLREPANKERRWWL